MDSELAVRLKLFSLSSEEKADIELEAIDIAKSKAECERSLVGKIFGIKKCNFAGLKYTTANIWQTKEPFTVREIGSNLFQFFFTSREDQVKVRDGKTWSFDSQYLILREWSENVLENLECFKSVELWVQLWDIPCHWMSIETGRKIGKKFSKLKDILIPNTGSSMGRHIKILVEIELDKALMRGTNLVLDGVSHWVSFKYENLQSFCFYCGMIGHTERGCQKRKDELGANNLRDGQFGEWMRAMELGLFRNGQRNNRNAASPEKTKPSEKKDINIQEGDGQEVQKVNEFPMGWFGSQNEEMQFNKVDSLPTLSQEDTRSLISKEDKDRGQEALSLEHNQKMGNNKENEMTLDEGDQNKVPRPNTRARSPLQEIQNLNRMEKSQAKKVIKKFCGKKISPKPMEISDYEADGNCGIKRSFELIEYEDEQNIGHSKRIKSEEFNGKENNTDKVEVASLKWALSYQ